MFKHTIVFILTSLLLEISCTTYQPNQHILIPAPEEDASQMLTEGGWDGDFGVTSFPRCDFGSRVGGVVHGWPAKGASTGSSPPINQTTLKKRKLTAPKCVSSEPNGFATLTTNYALEKSSETENQMHHFYLSVGPLVVVFGLSIPHYLNPHGRAWEESAMLSRWRSAARWLSSLGGDFMPIRRTALIWTLTVLGRGPGSRSKDSKIIVISQGPYIGY
jgi:hypothetical protein